MTEVKDTSAISDNELFWNEIHAPTVVAVPPIYAARDLCFCENGEIRHYGTAYIGGELRRIYIASSDWGLNWKTCLASDDDPGAMVKCPWDNYWLSLTRGATSDSLRSLHGPGTVAETVIHLDWNRQEPRLPLPLRHRRRWVAPISDVRCENGTCYHAAVCYSDDDGQTWNYVQVPEVPNVARQFACDKYPHWFNNGCEPTIAELDDGTLLMALRTSGEYVAFSRSTDAGETWSVPEPVSGFWQANTMPLLMKLRDGRLLFVWNNTAMLPTISPDELPEMKKESLRGVWETVFTNRDALHAAISEDDGKTWIGFREIILNGIRNNPDFRELGNFPGEEHDKSVHQSQALELPNGKIMLALGQNVSARKIVIFDPRWLYEKQCTEDFRHGLQNISHHLYVKSLTGDARGWAGHCAWNRVPGVVLAREPDADISSTRESLWLCRIKDPRLVSTRAGFVWNFPAAVAGVLEIDCRIEGDGFQIALQDHWSNPSDEYIAPRSFATIPISCSKFPANQWITIRIAWNCKEQLLKLTSGEYAQNITLNTAYFSSSGPSYLHIQSLAESEDTKGTFFREIRFRTI